MFQKKYVWILGILSGILLSNAFVGTFVLDIWGYEEKIYMTNLVVSIFVGFGLAVAAIIINDEIPKHSNKVANKVDQIILDCQYCGESFEIQKETKIFKTKCPNCGGPNKIPK